MLERVQHFVKLFLLKLFLVSRLFRAGRPRYIGAMTMLDVIGPRRQAILRQLLE
jgi:hypothetical protein